MQKIIKPIILILSIFILISCDAIVHMAYRVENQTDEEIEIFVPDYPIPSPYLSRIGERKDTVIVIKPQEEIVVGVDSKIDFPWGSKNIYRNNPGICGIKQLSKYNS